MKFSRVKKISYLLLTIVFSLAIIGCSSNESSGNSSSGDEEDITLEFWTINLKADFSEYFENLIAEYEENNPGVTINWVDVPGDDILQKFISELSSDDVPDVVNLSSFLLLDLPDGKLYPISELVDEETIDQYFPKMIESLTFNDETLGLPWYNSGPPVGLLNAEVYEEAGLDPDNPPENWDELLENGRIIHEQLPDVYGSNDFPDIEILLSNGIQIFSDDGKEAVFNTPEAVEFVEKFIEGYENGSIAEGVAAEVSGANSANIATYQQSLGNGLIAQNGRDLTTHLAGYEENAPRQFEHLKVFPSVTNNGEYAITNTMSFVIPQKTKQPEEAVDFALFVTNAQNQLEFSKLAPIFPSTIESMEDSYFTEIDDDTIYGEARKIQVDNIANMSITNVNIELRNEYRKEIAAVMLGQKTVEEALDDAVNSWNEALAE